VGSASPGYAPDVIDVWQAEWCPHSARVRALLTEKQVAAIMHQVPEARADRDVMRGEVGTDEIPVVVLEDGTVLAGETDGIIEELRRRFTGSGAEVGGDAPAGGTGQPAGAQDPRTAVPRAAEPTATTETADRPLGVPASDAEAELPGFPHHEPPSDG